MPAPHPPEFRRRAVELARQKAAPRPFRFTCAVPSGQRLQFFRVRPMAARFVPVSRRGQDWPKATPRGVVLTLAAGGTYWASGRAGVRVRSWGPPPVQIW